MKRADYGTISAATIAACFNNQFGASNNVCMSGGAEEPDYQPTDSGKPARIRYRSDYAHSALHEAAHWCIAGERRRELADYGYWYEPPPRDNDAQQAFAGVEAKVQGLEAIFAEAVGLPFQVSIDDVENLLDFEAEFTGRVETERQRWRSRGLPRRAREFLQALSQLPSGTATRG